MYKLIIFAFIIIMFIFETFLSSINYKNRNQVIPQEVSDIYDDEKYKNWLEYFMENMKFNTIMRSLGVVVLLFLLVSNAFVYFKDWANILVQDEALQYVLFMGFYFILNFLIDLYPSYYKQFTIEEKFGFNKMTKKLFIKDQIKSLLLTIIFGGGLIYLLATLYVNFGTGFYLYALVSIIVIFFIINIAYVPVIVPIFNKLSPLEDGNLKDKIEAYATSVGYTVRKISVMDASKRSSKLNAFFSGFGRFKNIVLYDTLIDKMSEEEIVSVLAHEVGHAKYKHTTWLLLFSIARIALILAFLLFVVSTPDISIAFGFDTTHFGFALIIFSVLLSPLSIFIDLFYATFSRKMEYQADAYARDTASEQDIISALKVLTRENYSNLTPHPLYVTLRYDHPPVYERIMSIKKK